MSMSNFHCSSSALTPHSLSRSYLLFSFLCTNESHLSRAERVWPRHSLGQPCWQSLARFGLIHCMQARLCCAGRAWRAGSACPRRLPLEMTRRNPNPLILLGGVLVPALGGVVPLRRGRWCVGGPVCWERSTPPPCVRRRVHQQAGYSPHAQRRWLSVDSFHRGICKEAPKGSAGRAWRGLVFCHAFPALILKPTTRELQERRHGRHLHADLACGQ